MGWITIPQPCQVKVWKGKKGETRTLLKHQKSCWVNQPKPQNPNKNENHEQKRENPYHSNIPEWLQDFRENLVDDRVPERTDSHASSSHESSLELMRSADLGKHSVYTHFPKDRNCEICQRTKITRAPCRRRNGGAVPRADNLGDLITAGHKVLSENCESRNNHRYAVVVQDSATQWIQSYPCKNKNFSGNNKKKKKKSSWSPTGILKSFTPTIPWNLAKPVKISPGIIARLHHTNQKQMGLLKEQCAEWKKVRLQLCRNQVWTKTGGRIPWNVIAISETFKISCLMGRLHTKGVLENLWKDPLFHLVHWLSITLLLRRTSQESINLERKSYLDCSLDTLCTRGGIWKGDVQIADIEELGTMDASEIYSKRLNAKEVIFPKHGEFIFPIADGRIKTPGGDQELRTSTLVRHRPIQGESNIDFLGESEGSLPQPHDSFLDAGEAINDFWSMSENFIYRHHVEPRVKLYSPIDVSRTTHTNSDVMQESCIDDYWNIDGSRDLSDSWTGITQFTL